MAFGLDGQLSAVGCWPTVEVRCCGRMGPIREFSASFKECYQLTSQSLRVLKWGVIGTGIHFDARVARAFARTSSSRIVAVCDRDTERAAAMASKHGIDRAHDCYDDLLADPRVEAVYVATPHSLHREHVERAAAAGKHVLCEKPLALTATDAAAMVDACRRAGVSLGVTFQNRQHPAHREARRMVAEGRVGNVMCVKAEYARLVPGDWSGWRSDPSVAGAGALMGMGVHPLDLVRYVTGQEVVELSAFMDVMPEGNRVDYSVAVMLRLSDGALAHVNSSRRFPFGANELVVYGDRARITTRGTVGPILRGSLEFEDGGPATKTQYSDPDPDTGLFAATIEDFDSSLAQGRPPTATGEDGLAMARLTEAVLASARDGRAVRL